LIQVFFLKQLNAEVIRKLFQGTRSCLFDTYPRLNCMGNVN